MSRPFCAPPASSVHLVGRALLPASFCLIFLGSTASRLTAAELRSQTLVAFERYVRLTEARMKRDRDQPGKFLYIDSLARSTRNQIMTEIQRGDVYLTELQTRDAAGHRLGAPDGWIHHWFAVMYVRGATVREAVNVIQDYDQYAKFYKPDIVRSRVLRHADNNFLVYVRLQKKTPWLTVSLDMDSDVHYYFAGPRRAYTVSHSTRIMQVEDAGLPDEHTDLPGQGGGYIWAMDSYWRLEQDRGGLIVEWESVALSRNPPLALRWLIRPFVRGAIRSTVRAMLIRTRELIQARNRRGR